MVNGNAATVVSGEVDALDELMASCEADGVRARRIQVDYASHSAQVERIERELLDVLAPIKPRAARIPFYSTVTGGLLDTTALDAGYWYRNLRQTVEFDRTIRRLTEQGVGVFIEASPHPVLAPSMEQTTIGTLRRNDGGLDRFLSVLAQAHTRGVDVDWEKVYEATGAGQTELPTYAFQHNRYWLNDETANADAASMGLGSLGHPLLGAMVMLAGSEEVVLTGRLSTGTLPWLTDHVIGGSILFPGTGFVELVIRAGDEVGCGRVEELTIEAPLVLAERGGVAVQVVVGAADEEGRREVQVYSRDQDATDLPWNRHATGLLATATSAGGGNWPSGPRPAPSRWTSMSTPSTRSWSARVWRTGRPSGGFGPPGGPATRCSPRSPCRTTRWRTPLVCTRPSSTRACTPSDSPRREPAMWRCCRSPGREWNCTPPARARCGCASRPYRTAWRP